MSDHISQPRYRFILRGVLALCLLAVAIGCSSSKPTNDPVLNPKHRLEFDIAEPGTASLKGKISHAGRPITAGRLCFFVKNALVPMAGMINTDGSYHAIGLPEGTLHVAVILDPNGDMPFPTPPRIPGMATFPGAGPNPPPIPGGAGMPGGPMTGGTPPGAGKSPPMAGGPGPGGPPAMPAPPAMGPGEAPMVGMPLKFPPHLLGQLTNFEVPPQAREEYSKLHRKYSQFGSKNVLTVTIKSGENVVDLVLP